jgi:glucose dehydrogenase
MELKRRRVVARGGLLSGQQLAALGISAVVFLVGCRGERALLQTGGPVDEWPSYGNDPGGMRYSPLDQIDRRNVSRLKVAWVFHTGDVSNGAAGESKLPAPGNSTPMTYRIRPDGKQYVVIAAGGHAKVGDRRSVALVAFAVP